jgi:hypothetical protein
MDFNRDLETLWRACYTTRPSDSSSSIVVVLGIEVEIVLLGIEVEIGFAVGARSESRTQRTP